MKYHAIVKELHWRDYSGDELEELGNRLCRQLFLHIGMLKYGKSGLKKFDITVQKLSELVDVASDIVTGVEAIKGVEQYTEKLQLLIGLVGSLEKSDDTKSIKRELRNSFENEMRNFLATSRNVIGYWTH